MPYTRKTRDVYVVQGLYPGPSGWEDVTEENTRTEGRARLREYRENCPEYPHRLIVRRERITPEIPTISQRADANARIYPTVG